MQAYRIEYRDWAYGEWFAASASPVDVYAASVREAEQWIQTCRTDSAETARGCK